MKTLDPYERCGPACVAEPPLLDTADGREHDACVDDDVLADEGDWLQIGTARL